MKFRRKSADPAELSAESESAAAEVEPVTGPFDIDEVPADDDVERIDLGSMLLAGVEGLELRLQVDEDVQEVQAVVMADDEGAVELRVYAAPRGGDLWSEVRPSIAAEYAQRGGTATERHGRFGPELDCQLTVRTDDGRTATQSSRIVGVNGPRWMLRATLLGLPAVQPDAAQRWEQVIEQVVVRRGSDPMMSGAELPFALPPQDQMVEHDEQDEQDD